MRLMFEMCYLLFVKKNISAIISIHSIFNDDKIRSVEQRILFDMRKNKGKFNFGPRNHTLAAFSHFFYVSNENAC